MDLKIDGWTKAEKPLDPVMGLNSPHLAAGSLEPKMRRDRPTLFSMRFCPYSERVLLVALHKDVE